MTLSNFTASKAGKLIVRERNVFIQAGNVLENALSAIKTVRAFNNEENEGEKHYKYLQAANHVSSNLVWFKIRINSISLFNKDFVMVLYRIIKIIFIFFFYSNIHNMRDTRENLMPSTCRLLGKLFLFKSPN